MTSDCMRTQSLLVPCIQEMRCNTSYSVAQGLLEVGVVGVWDESSISGACVGHDASIGVFVSRSQVRQETVLWGWSAMAMPVELASKCVPRRLGRCVCKTTCDQASSRLTITYLGGGELAPAGLVHGKQKARLKVVSNARLAIPFPPPTCRPHTSPFEARVTSRG